MYKCPRSAQEWKSRHIRPLYSVQLKGGLNIRPLCSVQLLVQTLPEMSSSSGDSPCGSCKKLVLSTDKALECDLCSTWSHLSYIGAPTKSYELLQKCSRLIPWICASCKTSLGTVVSTVQSLKQENKALRLQLAELKASVGELLEWQEHTSTGGSTELQTQNEQCVLKVNDTRGTTSDASRLCLSQDWSSVAKTKPPVSEVSSSNERKFNIFMYGMKESKKGTSRGKCMSNDLNSASNIIGNICPDITCQAIRDCIRLGRYSEDRCRPMLVKLNRSCDVFSTLANRYKLTKSSGVYIKAHQSKKERVTELTLLRQRWSLLQSGHDKKQIRI